MPPIIPPNTSDFKEFVGIPLDKRITNIIMNSRGFG
jgi:hypothetical protein